MTGAVTGSGHGGSIAALVLAAGRSQRMGCPNKLLSDLHGQPLIVRTVDGVLASRAGPVVVVTGHDGAAVAAALAGRPLLNIVFNPDHAGGLSTSLRAGLAALPATAAGVVVCLGDMPLVSPALIDRLIAAHAPARGVTICVPVAGGRRGNPVLFDRRHFPDMAALTGDSGARTLLDRYGSAICEVPADDDGVLLDVDTPEALATLRARRVQKESPPRKLLA
jgi:molybdenum cofactor cytidylyltransferase